MAPNAAGDRARQALLEQATEEEAITVNQRALIDKILARYAAEFTVFRELLQNADDAGATNCELRFETQKQPNDAIQAPTAPPVLPDLKATLQNWVFKNDGKPFGKDDWSRLRRIAEGNPDPDRIGAFGVGFYSLFSICEEPIVSSADELMGFFWKDDALFTRRAKNTNAEVSPDGNPWTTFFMSLREPAPFPESPLALAKFLATSLTFTTRVRIISLYWDDQLLCRLSKKLSSPKAITMPAHLTVASPARIMKVQSLQSTSVQIDVQAMNLVIASAEKDRPKPKQSLASALSKTASSGLTSMLQSAFGFSSSSASSSAAAKEKERAAREREAQIAAAQKQATASLASMLTSLSASIHLRIATAHINVSADRAFEKEIERSTKKPPPKTTAFHIIFTGKEEYDASFPPEDDPDAPEGQRSLATTASNRASLDTGVRQIFQGLMPRLEEQGHAFIGFRTHQTSGFSGHIAARFIPTVERESLDFIDRYCAKWNSELLSMGGYLARAVYEIELSEVGRLWKESIGAARPADDNKQAQLLKERALHLMRFFTFRTSSPTSRVSSLFETSFFGASRQATISLMSTRGVKHSAAIRVPNAQLADFVKDLAVIPPEHVEHAPEFVREVRTRNLVHEITMDDVFKELGGRALSPPEMVACLKWWITVAAHPSYNISLRSKLLDNGILSIPAPSSDADSKSGSSESVQPLRAVRTFLNPQRVPTDVPVPESTISYEVSKHLTPQEMARVFDWSELTVPVWLSHIVKISAAPKAPAIDANIQLSPTFSEKILLIIARAWGSLSPHQQAEIASILRPIPCIPTRKGMQPPEEAYFANVSLFSDLPIVALPAAQVKGNLEKVLIALGVRRHVELQMIFNRLIAAGDWSHVDLVSYLASNKESLSTIERERLTKTAMFPKQGEVGPLDSSGKPRIIRYRASELYEPIQPLRALKLPVLDWPDKVWKSGSDEAKFVFDLGLRRHPPLQDLLALASNTADDELRSRALSYLLDKFVPVYRPDYSLTKASPYAFVPCMVEGKKVLHKPTEAFTNPEASVMGWPVVSPDVNVTDLPKLGLRSNPTSNQLIGRLTNNPTRDEVQARKVFEYLSSVSEFSLYDYGILRNAEFIPVRQQRRRADDGTKASSADKPKDDPVHLVAPMNCYFGGAGGSSTPQFRDVFSYCDYGPVAGAFLRNCGVTDEPSIEEVAKRLVAEPQRFYQLAGSTDAYLGILRQIATNWDRIRGPLRSEMKRSAFLLGSKRITQTNDGKPAAAKASLIDANDDEEDETDDPGTLVYALKKPSEVVIVDDANSHLLFGSSVFFAPHEDLLQEGLYEQLGSPRLSSLVEERYSAEGQLREQTQRGEEVRALVLERTPLFLFEKRSTAKLEVRRDAEWLKAALEVVEVDGAGLRLTRKLRFGTLEEVNVQKCSAMASMRGKRLTLFLSSGMELDFFEMAMALNKHLLTRQRLQEVLLFMTLLSTSLRNLKRRGFHVDKILQQRKADREAAEARMREERMQAELEKAKQPSEADYDRWRKQVLGVFPDADPAHVDRALRAHDDAQVERTTNDMLQNSYPRIGGSKEKAGAGAMVPPPPPPPQSQLQSQSQSQSLSQSQPPSASVRSGLGSSGLFSGWKSRFMQAGKGPSSLADGTSSIERERGPSLPGGWGAESDGMVSRSGSGGGGGVGTIKTPSRGPEVTPQSTIASNVLRAIAASRPDASSQIKSEAQTSTVEEARQTYCDTTGISTDLRLAGVVAGMNVFLSPELDDTTLERHHDALTRLITRIYLPVGAIFGLDPRAMNVYCDSHGPSIAFNRAGAIYLNLRYYLAWHDDDVQAGALATPLVSTYFSVAHEIAHNVVEAHNAEHEWYFSAIAEKYIVSLVEYIHSTEES